MTTKKHIGTPVLGSPRTALSLFSGCGGYCEGIELADFDVRAAIEFDRFAAETYRFNFPKTPLIEGDVTDFLRPDSGDESRYRLNGVDLVFGGPPCQGYSQIGTRDVNDERNSLYKQFVRIVDTLRPRIFLMENVPNLILMNRGLFRDQIIRAFAKIGYSNATYVRVSAADFGVPQIRQRVIFLATRDEDRLNVDLKSFYEAALESQAVRTHVTVDQAISDLPSNIVHSGEDMKYPKSKESLSNFQKLMRMDFSRAPYTKSVKLRRGIGSMAVRLYNHHTKEILERRKNLIALLKQGAKADSLPKEVWNGKRPEKWRRLHPDLPSYTILAQMHRDLSEWVHPHLERWITVREAARLQSFHDGFVFPGSEWQQLKQIGNAVPPLLAHALGKAAQEVLNAIDSKPVVRKRGKHVPLVVQTLLPGIEVA